MIAGIVLAAGSSSRLGQPKQLLPYGQGTLLGATLALAHVALDPVVVVLGAAAAEIRARVDLGRAIVVENPDYAQGQATSLIAGVRALIPRPEVEAALVMLGDQPRVRPEVLAALSAAWRADPALHAVVPVYGAQRGNPVLFARAAWPALLALTGDTGARALFAAGRLEPTQTLAFPADWWPRDVDTWEDYQALIADQPTT